MNIKIVKLVLGLTCTYTKTKNHHIRHTYALIEI